MHPTERRRIFFLIPRPNTPRFRIWFDAVTQLWSWSKLVYTPSRCCCHGYCGSDFLTSAERNERLESNRTKSDSFNLYAFRSKPGGLGCNRRDALEDWIGPKQSWLPYIGLCPLVVSNFQGPSSKFCCAFLVRLYFVFFSESHLSCACPTSTPRAAQLQSLDYLANRVAKTVYFLLFAALQGVGLATILRAYATADLLRIVVQAGGAPGCNRHHPHHRP